MNRNSTQKMTYKFLQKFFLLFSRECVISFLSYSQGKNTSLLNLNSEFSNFLTLCTEHNCISYQSNKLSPAPSEYKFDYFFRQYVIQSVERKQGYEKFALQFHVAKIHPQKFSQTCIVQIPNVVLKSRDFQDQDGEKIPLMISHLALSFTLRIPRALKMQNVQYWIVPLRLSQEFSLLG